MEDSLYNSQTSLHEPDKHKCVSKPVQSHKHFNGQSEYNTEYVSRFAGKREPIKPKSDMQLNEGRVSDVTTHRTDYIPLPLDKHYVHTQEPYRQPEGEVEKLTSYRTEYTEKPLEPSKAVKREYGPRSNGKFEGEPSYKSDYKQWEVLPREKLSYGGIYEPPSAPFEGTSNYTTEYLPHQGKPRSSKKPKETPRSTDQPIQDMTDYRESYTQHPMPKKFVRERAMWEGSKVPLSTISNYQQDYTAKSQQKTESCRPLVKPISSTEPLGNDTTFKRDYKQWPLGDRFVHEYPAYEKPAGVMESNTTSHTDYTKKPIEKMAAIKPVSEQKALGKFDGATSYREEYKPHDASNRTQPMRKSEYMPNEARFEGIPTYTTDYVQHGAASRTPFKPIENTQRSEQPFETRTEYRDDYVRHSLPERFQRERPKWNGATAPLDAQSTYTKDYPAKDSGRQESFKPNLAPLHTDVPFEDGTTNRHDYKSWPVNRIHKHEQPAYNKPDGAMESQTTNQVDYTAKPIDKVAAIRPQQSQKELGKFDDHTNYREEYRNWDNKGRQKPIVKGEYSPPEAPFEGRSNYTDDFVRRPIELTRSMKKNDTGYASNARFEDDTEYRNEYTKKAMPACPAVEAERNSTNYVFHEEDPSGHRYYASSIPKLPQINNTPGQQTVLVTA